jgi:hypothetical protein
MILVCNAIPVHSTVPAHQPTCQLATQVDSPDVHLIDTTCTVQVVPYQEGEVRRRAKHIATLCLLTTDEPLYKPPLWACCVGLEAPLCTGLQQVKGLRCL